jgi:hypothetical protein
MDHAKFSSMGGKAGTGAAKVRGDSAYYSGLVAKRQAKRAAGKVKGNARQRRTARRSAR